jgi:C-terminal processing protease CtpA/Prc
LLKPSNSTLKASETESQTSKPAESNENEGEGKEKYEEYEVEIEQSYGLKFAKGRDGATYIDAIAPGGSADKTGKFSVGDKVIATRFYFLSFLLFKIKLLSLRT